MDGAFRDLGRILLLTLPPGAPFMGAMAALVIVLAIVRQLGGKTRAGRAWLAAWRIVEHTGITLLLVSMVVLSLVQIVLRNVFETGFVWLDPLLRHGVLWLGFLGAMLATAEDRHISVDALSRLLHGQTSHAVHATLRVAAAGVALALANACYLLARAELEFESVSFLGIPTWALMSIMPWGLVVMSYRFVVSAWRGRPPDPVPSTGAPSGRDA
jgi:TRAP-type C4-dicarboxylate transport system permease small subunit